MKMLRLAAFAAILLFAFCQKASEKSPIPKIEFRALSSAKIRAGIDSLAITVFYEDGDGDLGENSAAAKNCFVQDSRSAALLYEFRVKQLAPDGATIAIQGELDVILPKTGFVQTGATSEKAVFKIRLVDRAGNSSNEIETPEIEITK